MLPLSTHRDTSPQDPECISGYWLKYECGSFSIIGGADQEGYSDGTSSLSLFHGPSGISFSPDGIAVYVADQFNNRCVDQCITCGNEVCTQSSIDSTQTCTLKWGEGSPAHPRATSRR